MKVFNLNCRENAAFTLFRGRRLLVVRCVNHAFMHWSLTPWHKLVSAAAMEEITESSLSQVGIYKFLQGETKQNNQTPNSPTCQTLRYFRM